MSAIDPIIQQETVYIPVKVEVRMCTVCKVDPIRTNATKESAGLCWACNRLRISAAEDEAGSMSAYAESD